MAKLREEQVALLGMRESNLFGAAASTTTEAAALAQCRAMMRQASNRTRDLRFGEIGSQKAQIAEQPESLTTLAQRHLDRNKAASQTGAR